MRTAFSPRLFAVGSNGNVGVCDLHQGNQGYGGLDYSSASKLSMTLGGKRMTDQ
jgi:hypothetical protein